MKGTHAIISQAQADIPKLEGYYKAQVAQAREEARSKEEELLDHKHKTFNIAEKIVDIEEHIPGNEGRASFGK